MPTSCCCAILRLPLLDSETLCRDAKTYERVNNVCVTLLSLGWNTFFKKKLDGTAHYAGRLLATAEVFGLWPRDFFALLAKKKTLICCFGQF